MEWKAGDRALIPFHEPNAFNPNPPPVEAELILFYPNEIRMQKLDGSEITFGPRWAAKVIAPGKGIHHWLVEVDAALLQPLT